MKITDLKELATVNPSRIRLESVAAKQIVKRDCNSFLKTKQGFHYLMMKYPHLSLSQAINEYIKEAMWIDSTV